MRYIKSFSTSGDVQTAIDNGSLGKPYVAYIESDGVIDWNTKEIDYSKIPLTFEIISGGTINWKLTVGNDRSFSRTISYSKDGGNTWTEITASLNNNQTIQVEAGDVLMFKGDNATYYNDISYVAFYGSTAVFKLYGNIMSLINSTGFTGVTVITSDNALQSMFRACTGLTSAENLVLPATTLATSCYNNMFQGDKSLTTAPELPATTLAPYCYYYMFQGCSSLNYIKCLATDISATNCTKYWVYGVQTNSGTFVKSPGMEDWEQPGVYDNGIPTNWTVQDA